MSKRTKRKTVPISGLWLRREGNDLVALVEMPDGHGGHDWHEAVRVAVDGGWVISHIVETSGLIRYVSEDYGDG